MANNWISNHIDGITPSSSPTPKPIIRATPTVAPVTQAKAPVVQQQPQKDLGLLGKAINFGEKIDKSLSTNALKTISAPYNALKYVTGNALKGLNKVFVQPVDRFAAGAVKSAQTAQADRSKDDPIMEAVKNSPINWAYGGAKNVITGKEGTFGNGVDVTGGVLPDKPLISPEMGRNLDTKASDFLLGKGTAGKLASAFSNPRWGVNLATNIATPGIPAVKILKAVGEVPKVQKTVEAIGDVVKSSPMLTKVAETVKPGSIFPEFQKIIKESDFNTNLRQTELYKRLQEVTSGMSKTEKEIVSNLMEGGKVIKGNDRAKQLEEIATEMNNVSNKIGQEMVDTGIITPESFSKYKDQYLTHIKTDVFDQLQKDGIRIPKELRGGGGFLSGITTPYAKERTGKLTDYSRDFAPVMMTGLGSEIKAIEKNKALEKIVGTFGGDTMTAQNHVRVMDIPGIPRFYQNKYKNVTIPSPIAEKIASQFYSKPSSAEKVADFFLNTWKQFKTTKAGTPSYFIRNTNSNIGQIAIETDGNVARAMKNNFSSMAELGGLKKTEPLLNEYLTISNAQPLAQKVRNLLTGNDKTFSIASLLSPTEFQNWQEHAAKYTIYKSHRASGMEMAEAWDRANKAIFSPTNISKAEKGGIKYLIPFYNWQRQEIPYFLKTYAKNPERYAAYSKTKEGIERLSPKPEGVPDYMQGQIRLPSKDEQGSPQYLDASYHIPFGTFTRTAGENDLPLGFNLNPLIGDLPDIAKGRNPQYGTPLTRSNVPSEQESAKATAIKESLGPNVLRELGGLKSAVKGEAEKYTGRKRTVGQWVARQLGTKITSFSPEKQKTIDSIGKNEAQKNYSSMRYNLQDQRRRGVITQEEYTKRLEEERQALQEILRK